MDVFDEVDHRAFIDATLPPMIRWQGCQYLIVLVERMTTRFFWARSEETKIGRWARFLRGKRKTDLREAEVTKRSETMFE